MTEPTLEFIAKQIERILTEIRAVHDELRVQGAMILRIDGTLISLLREMNETHTQIARMNDRIRKFEDAEITS
jgi:hypothetical protein